MKNETGRSPASILADGAPRVVRAQRGQSHMVVWGSERSEDNPTWLCGDPRAARTIPCVLLAYLHGLYPTDRNSMRGVRMAFAKWYYIYLVILFINNLYKAGH